LTGTVVLYLWRLGDSGWANAYWFQEYVRSGQIHYFLGGGVIPAESGGDASQRIADWVAENFTAAVVDGVAGHRVLRRHADTRDVAGPRLHQGGPESAQRRKASPTA
jgi:hypothetical protein